MARRAQDDKIANLVVGALAVQMTYLQNVGYPEAAVRAHWRVVLERELPVIDALHTRMRRGIGLTSQTLSFHESG